MGSLSAAILANGELATIVHVDHDLGGGDDFRSILVASIGTPGAPKDLFNALLSNKWSNGLALPQGLFSGQALS